MDGKVCFTELLRRHGDNAVMWSETWSYYKTGLRPAKMVWSWAGLGENVLWSLRYA